MDQILDYMHKWKLKINSQKTQAITFTRRLTKLTEEITVNGQQIPWNLNVKYLRVTLDRKMTWPQQSKQELNLHTPHTKKSISS